MHGHPVEQKVVAPLTPRTIRPLRPILVVCRLLNWAVILDPELE